MVKPLTLEEVFGKENLEWLKKQFNIESNKILKLDTSRICKNCYWYSEHKSECNFFKRPCKPNSKTALICIQYTPKTLSEELPFLCPICGVRSIKIEKKTNGYRYVFYIHQPAGMCGLHFRRFKVKKK